MSRIIIVILCVIFAGLTCGCPDDHTAGKPEAIFRDAYSLYVLDPGPFVDIEPEYPVAREFLILKAGEVEISCGLFKGAGIEVEGERLALSVFANSTVIDENWLPGVARYLLDGSMVMIGDREYYVTTLLARRDPELTARLDYITLSVHARELDLYPPAEDRIVKQYYTTKGSDIYIFTLSGTPEDIAYREPDIRKLLASVRLSATEAVQETHGER